MQYRYKLKSSLLFLFFCCLYGIALIRLYSIQIYHNEFYATLGKRQYNVRITTTPQRATINDCNGNPLALNKDALSAFITPNNLEDTQELSLFLARHFPQAHKRLHNNPTAHFLYVKRKLTKPEQQLIEQSTLKDIHLLQEPNRYYPCPYAGIVTGITSIDNEGLFGIELQCNQQLAGSPTTVTLEKDARSGHFYFKKQTTVQGHDGQPVTLTLDSDLQFLAYEELKKTVQQFNAQEGAVVILDPVSGNIAAMVTYPDFDPNDTQHLTLAHTKNKVLTEKYELGSVVKVFTALAALEEEVVTPDELINCENVTTGRVNNRLVNTWKAQGTIPFTEVIQYSNNIGIAKIAHRLDEKLYKHFCRLGFGTKTGVPFPGEQAGFVNPPSSWSKHSLISLSYGYEIAGTLLQLAQAFGVIANDGYSVHPRLMLDEPQPTAQQLYQPSSVEAIKKILRTTIQQGTAYRAHIHGYDVMGKTGTANLLVDGKYSNHNNIYTFAGIIEKESYRRVIVTFVKEAARKNLYASQVAAPLFERIATKVLIHDKVINSKQA